MDPAFPAVINLAAADPIADWIAETMQTLGAPGAGLLIALENLFSPLTQRGYPSPRRVRRQPGHYESIERDRMDHTRLCSRCSGALPVGGGLRVRSHSRRGRQDSAGAGIRYRNYGCLVRPARG